MNLERVGRLAVAAVLAAGSVAALADPSTFAQRNFYMEGTSSFGVHFSAEDLFTSGDPYGGIKYDRPGFPTTAGSYLASTFSPGAERTGPASDFAGIQFGLGELKFRYGDATDTTTNLTPAGYTARSLSLVPQPIAGELGVVNRNGWFDMDSAWNFAVPKPGESILFGLLGTGGPDYIDRLRLRLASDVQTGQPRFLFEQESRSGSTVARTVLGSVALQDVYANLAEVDYLDLELSRDAPSAGTPNPGVHATVWLFDAAYDPAISDAKVLATYTFAAQGYTFLTPGDAGRYSAVLNAVTWLAPVPEPGRWALMAVGLGALGFVAGRRKG